MNTDRPVGPLAWMALGAIVLFLGIGYIHDEAEPLGVAAAIAGAGLLLFGLIAQAVKVGVRAAKNQP